MDISLNNLLFAIVALLALVIFAQIAFFNFKEKKLNTLLEGVTAWMANQERINNAISLALVELDTNLVDNKLLPKSIVNGYVRESSTEPKEA